MLIRKGIPEDLPILVKMYREARNIQLENGNLHQWREGYPSEEIISADIARGELYIIEEKKLLAGAFVLIFGKDPTYNIIEGKWIDDETPYATIHRLGSFKSSKGVAKTCFDWCWGQINNLRIDTHKDNSIMRHCIEKAGFEYCGVIHLLNGDPRMAYQKIK